MEFSKKKLSLKKRKEEKYNEKKTDWKKKNKRKPVENQTKNIFLSVMKQDKLIIKVKYTLVKVGGETTFSVLQSSKGG